MNRSLTPKDIEAAQNRLNEYELRRPDVVNLAMLSSLARRIEPEVLRDLRLGLADRLADRCPPKHRPTVATEAALWFSPLLESRGSDNITLLPGFSHLLRERLKKDQELLEKAHEIIERCHQSISPVIRWEEDLVYLSLKEDFSEPNRKLEFEQKVLRAIKAIKTGRRPGLEQWIMEMRVRVPDAANCDQSFRSLLKLSIHEAGKQLDFSDVPTTVIEVQMIESVFRLGFLNGKGQYGIRVPDLPPIQFYVLGSGDTDVPEERVIPLGGFVDISVEPEPTEIRTIDGNIYLLDGKSFETTLVVEQPPENRLRPANILKGHRGQIWGLAITPDDKRLISGSYDQTLIIWDVDSGRPIRSLRGHTDRIFGVTVTQDGKSLISCSADGTLRVWDIETGLSIAALRGHDKGVYCAATTPDGRRIITGSFDTTLRIWDLKPGDFETRVVFSWDRVPGRDDGRFIEFLVQRYGIDWARKAKIEKKDISRTIEISDEQKSLSLKLNDEKTRAILQIGNLVRDEFTVRRENGELNVYKTGPSAITLQGHSDSVFGVEVTPDGRYAVSASADRTLRVWDLEAKASVAILEGHSGPIDHVAITRDGTWIISGSRDKTARVWDLMSGKMMRVLEGHSEAISGLAAAPNGLWAITCSFDKTIRIWDVVDGTCEDSIALTKYPVNIAMTSDLKRAILASDDNDVWIWDIPIDQIKLIEKRHQTKPPVPHMIPPPPRDFVGREEELAEILKDFERGATITGLVGMGGVGKTALALVLADRLKAVFPDGQIFINLLGTSENPLAVSDAMAHVIRSFLGVDARIPDGPGKLAGLYQSVLSGRRALLLLDNALGREQVEPLLPPSGSAVIVTSRNKFTLPGLRDVDLDILSLEDAKKLLLEIDGRIGEYAEELAKLCGCLPLALRNAASLLAERKDLNVADYMEWLKDANKRLELVDASFTLSYDLLTPMLQKLWSMLSVFPADFDREGATAVWALDPDSAAGSLSDLVKWSLVEYDPVIGRYRLHNQARVFASARLPEGESLAAHERHAQYYRDLLSAADDLYKKGGPAIQSGLELFDSEEANIKAGQSWVEKNLERDSSAAGLCMSYPDAGVYVLDLRLHPREKTAWLETGIVAARRLKDRAAEGAHLGNLGLVYADLGDAKKAIENYEQALAIAREIGNRRAEGNHLGNLGQAYADLGDARKAIEYYEQQLVIVRKIGDKRGEGNALGNLGNAYAALGDVRKAIKYYDQALAIAREIGDRRADGAYLGNLGQAYADLGDPRKAIEYYDQALAIAREIGDRRGEGASLGNLGNAYAALGDAWKPIEYYDQALAIAREISDRRAEGNHLGNLGLTYAASGDARKAIEYYDQALAIAREISDRRAEGNHLGNLGLAYAALGDARKAIEYYEQQLVIVRKIGDKRGEGNALGNLGLACAALGDNRKAIEYYDWALAIAQEIGDRRGEGADLGNLGQAYANLGDARKATEYYDQALAIAREIGDRRNEGNWLGNLGAAYYSLGDASKAIEYYEQTLAIAQDIGDRRGEGADLGNLGLACVALGDSRKAIEYYEQALAIAREIGDRRNEGNWLGNLGAAYYSLGDASKAIEYYDQALAIARKTGDRRGEGADLGNLGGAYHSMGETRKALDYYEQQLEIVREIGDRRAEGNSLWGLAICYKEMNDLDNAISKVEAALKIFEQITSPDASSMREFLKESIDKWSASQESSTTMTQNIFSQGHALIVGVGADLPSTINDAQGLAKILKDPARCAYIPDQVELLTSEAASRSGILSGLDRIAKRADKKSTVVIYFSGHGYHVKSSIGDTYYLMPFGYDFQQLKDTAISGSEFADKLRAIRAQKLLILLDCSHAGGLVDLKAPGLVFSKSPLPPEAQRLSARGQQRVVIASSQADEVSFAGRPYSPFTLALIEALCGKGASKKDGYVRVVDLMLYTRDMVPKMTKNRQHPIMDFKRADNFVLAYYAGGESEPKGLPFAKGPEIAPEPGEWSRGRVFDQHGQTVHGPQTNIAGNVSGPVFSGQFSGPVASGGDAVDIRGSSGAIYKPSGPISQQTGDRISFMGNITGDSNVIGSLSHSTVINQSRQTASLDDFMQKLKALKQELAQAGVDSDTAAIINGDLDIVYYQAHKKQTNRIILMSKLKSAAEMLATLDGSAAAIGRMNDLAESLLALAGQLFK